MIVLAVLLAFVAGISGLLLSFHAGAPSGPSIILVAGVIYVASLFLGSAGGWVRQLFPGRHLEA